jgi:hypothetical protein
MGLGGCIDMRGPITSLSFAVVPIDDSDAPDPSDEWIQRISRETGFTAESIAQLCAEVFSSALVRTGVRPALEDIVAAVEVTIHEKTRGKRVR